MDGPLIYFLVALISALLGTIPFGPINLAVVKTTVDLNATRGTEMAVAASLVEIVEALIAISFGMVISNYLESNAFIKVIIALAFFGLAAYILTRKSTSGINNNESDNRPIFIRGLLIAALNPQAIPFWIFALAAISQYFTFEYEGINLLAFLGGVATGKLIALYGFVVTSNYLKDHLQQSGLLVNRLLAGVLVFIGITQLWTALPA